VKGPLRNVINCHCNQCTRLNGNYGSHSKVLKIDITITKDEGLSWFQISNIARRGFCGKCGSGLFWEQYHQDSTGIIAGSLDYPTGLKTIGHIFVGDKSDFYQINDDFQQFQASSNGKLEGDYL
jgi:hypothetical protein